MTSHQIIPVLRIFDEAKAREFYVDFLGFQIDWQHRYGENFPLYQQVSRGGCVLHLSEHHGDGCPGANLYIKIRGLDALHRELIDKQYKYYRPGIEEAGWARVMSLTDPFGNTLRFAEEPPPPAPYPVATAGAATETAEAPDVPH